MIHWLLSLMASIAATVLITAALVYIVSPKHGGELFRRLAVFLVGAFVGICVICQFGAHLGSMSVMLLGLVFVFAAYFMREACRKQSRHAIPLRRGAERTPVIPQRDDGSDDE